MHPALATRGLYAITDGLRPDLLAAADRALAGGARILQYRTATDDPRQRLEQARGLQALCAARGVPLLINGDARLAAAVGAAGVHLGEWGDDVADARALLGPGAVIGLSCKGSLAMAHEAVAAGVDYVSFGAFFPSPTLPDAAQVPPALLRDSAALGVPRVAIGGITPDNARCLVDAGVEFVASISAVFGADDVTAAARRFQALFPRSDRDPR